MFEVYHQSQTLKRKRIDSLKTKNFHMTETSLNKIKKQTIGENTYCLCDRPNVNTFNMCFFMVAFN